ncbi:MAG: glycoside hydrolase family 2, partial [Paramuribaculum sp.]|nr:glycoside hydrolase family 2 [Paramuribaculum sp.]
QSGGPWVRTEQSMRHIVSDTVSVYGPRYQQIKLPVIGKECQDVALIAYPAFIKNPFSQTFTLKKVNSQKLVNTLKLDTITTLRSLIVKVSTPFNSSGTLKVKRKGRQEILKTFRIDRFNDQNIVGFDKYAPIAVSLPETKVDEVDIEIDGQGDGPVTIILSEQPVVERFSEKQLAKMCQEPLPMWDYYMWDPQPQYIDTSYAIDPRSVITIDGDIDGDAIEWDVPKGKWIIERIRMSPTGVTNSPAQPEATGLEIDKMNSHHLEAHFNAYMGEILRRIPPEERRTLRVLVEDSYETGGQNWTDSLAEIFETRYGYSPLPYLPVLRGKVVGNNDISDRFLWDLRRLVADRVADEYVGGLKKIANKNGLTTWLENYGHWGFPGEFLQYGGQSDEIAGEFWSEGTLGDIENRASSSCGHIYGKQRIWAESCTAGGNPFGRYPAVMKQRVDRFFTEGINASLLHLIIHQSETDAEPGIAAWFGNEFNRKNVWSQQLDLFTDYLRRCNYVLQQGRYIADAAYFIGEDTPKMTGVCDPPLPRGYSFDYINADILMNRARVRDGRLVLDSGMEYALLVLPDQETMRPELLERIRQFVNDGLTVVGPAPERSPSLQDFPQCDIRVKEIAKSLWNSDTGTSYYGQGRVYKKGTSLKAVFDDLGITPDITFDVDDGAPLFIHRETSDAQIYFLANPLEKTCSVIPEFRVKQNLKPQVWNPVTGEIRALPQYAAGSNKGISVPITMNPLESMFVVFVDNHGAGKGDDNFSPAEIVADITHGPWTISFDPSRGGPDTPVACDSLFDWTTHPDYNISHYSGNAVYTTVFDLDSEPEGDILLDLGHVMVMGKVRVNGMETGGVWTPPYVVDITSAVRPGKNKIEVDVVSTWRNRLIGDATLDAENRVTSLNLNFFDGTEPLQPSGLIGPVRILKRTY